MSLTDQTAIELLVQLQSGQVTSLELVRAYLDRIERHDPAVKAFLRVDPSAALGRAEQIDARGTALRDLPGAAPASPSSSRVPGPSRPVP